MIAPGCARFISNQRDDPFPKTFAPPLVVGQTTYANVLERMGPPAELGSLPDGFYFRYRSATSIGFRFHVAIWTWVKLGFAVEEGKISSLLLFFDAKGILHRYIRDRYPEDAGWGLVAGHLWSPDPRLHIETHPPVASIHQWGMRLLDRPIEHTQQAELNP